MNEERLAPSKYSIRTSSGLSAGTGRDAHRPLLVWRKHKTCLLRQTIPTQVLGIAKSLTSRSFFSAGVWGVERESVWAGKMVCQYAPNG